MSILEYFARIIGEYLTKHTGFNVLFESAIVPRWKEGVIRFENVSLVCNKETWMEIQRKCSELKNEPFNKEGVDCNWTYWDINVEKVDVTLSLWRWLNGKGLLTECKMKGVRGSVDRAHIKWDENWTPKRRTLLDGDFELDKFVVDDLQMIVTNPNTRPFTISIFRGEFPLLRKQWLLYDFISADSIVGTYDNCLFSVHKPQGFSSGNTNPWASKVFLNFAPYT